MNTAASPWARATTSGRFLPRSMSPVTWLQARNTPAGVRIQSSGTTPAYPGPKTRGISQGATRSSGTSAAAVTQPLPRMPSHCIRPAKPSTRCLDASRGKATFPIADTSGIGSTLQETAIAYRPRTAGGTAWERTSWSRLALRAAGVRAAIWDTPYRARGRTSRT